MQVSMSDITFRKVYDSAKDIINKNNPNVKISKLSSTEVDTINKIIGRDVDGRGCKGSFTIQKTEQDILG